GEGEPAKAEEGAGAAAQGQAARPLRRRGRDRGAPRRPDRGDRATLAARDGVRGAVHHRLGGGMSKQTRLELTWIGKENRPRLEPRILLEEPERSYHA